jgi:hypothetical protein
MGDTSNTSEDIRKTAKAFAEGVNQKVHEMLSKFHTPADEAGSGVIENEGLLDLTGAKSPDDLAHIRSIRNVGMVLVPESLTAALSKIQQTNVGAIVPIPALGNGKLRVMSGQLKLAGDAFAGEENADDFVVLAGQIVFTSVVQTCRVRGLIIAGQLCAPQGSEVALGKATLRMSGQTIYFPAAAEPRILLGNQEFSELFFQSLSKPVVLVLIGNFDLTDDVTPASLHEKLAGLVIVGRLKCHAALKPIVQAICNECIGSIEAR